METFHRLLVPLQAQIISTGVDLGSGIRCLGCGARLTLHQPEPDQPDRLLGTCPEGEGTCRSWHLITWLPGQSEALVTLLPRDGGQSRVRPDASGPATSRPNQAQRA